jgi:hypothetical protein
MSLIDDVRLDLGDDGATPTFSDDQISDILVKAARRVNRVLSLTGSDAIVLASGVFTQPTETDELRDLVLLQAECLLMQRSATSDIITGAAGIIVKDGEQSIDTTDRSAAVTELLSNQSNPCEELKHAYNVALINRTGDDGRLIW